MGFIQLVRKTDPYVLWVLALMLAAYLLNQLDRYTVAITIKDVSRSLRFGEQDCYSVSNKTFTSNLSDTQCSDIVADRNNSISMVHASDEEFCDNVTLVQYNETYFPYGDLDYEPCYWTYNGQGSAYQILAGTYFIIVYTLAGIPLGFLADIHNRKVMLSIAVIVWSAMTVLTGFSKKYWHLVLLRMGLALGEAGCTPMAVSILSDYFPADLRGSALGVYNWGIYTGYSMSYALGNAVTASLGWRYVYYISGGLGFVVAPLILFTVKEPPRSQNAANGERSPMPTESTIMKIKSLVFQFIRPAVLLLCIAGGIRNAGGYVWAFNTQTYFELRHQTKDDIEKFMSWIPLVGGSLGALFGGFISDRLVVNRGLNARIWVLIISQIVAAPFAAGALIFDAPYSYLCLIPSNVFGEMWVGVTIAILVELVPSRLRTSSVAVYLFIISMIGGNMPSAVTPIKNYFRVLLNASKSDYRPLRNALLLLFPGMYVLGSLLFLGEMFVLRIDKRRRADDEVQVDGETAALIVERDNVEGEGEATIQEAT